MCIQRSCRKDTAGNRKLAKDKAIGRIDGMVALSMAMGVEGIYFEEEAEFSAMAAIG